ncbi:hypothetical protein [Fontibacillus sp. BL9]
MSDKETLIEIIKRNDVLVQVFDKVRELELESYFVGAGCITQTIWN